MKFFNSLLISALSFCALSATACAHEIKFGNLVIHHPWIRQPIATAKVAGAYTTIDNTGAQDDVLLKVTVEGVPLVQIHDMEMQGDTMKMREREGGLLIPAGKSVALKPKSRHIMLMNMKSNFMQGEEVQGTFTFAKAGTIQVDFEVSASGEEEHKHQ